MPPRQSIDDKLRLLREIRNQGDVNTIREAVTKYLSDGSNLVVAEAAKLVGEFELSGFEPVLLAAWERLFNQADRIKADKGCAAKAAIIESLGRLSYDEPEFFLEAIVYQQVEPAWPKANDTAENVRAGSAFALACSKRLRAVDKLNAFVDYMQGTRVDRVSAVKAIAATGSESALPLLRLKLLSGDGEVEVLGACMAGLLELAPESSIPLVARFLANLNEEIVLEAAAALGTCGRPKAIEALISTWKKAIDTEIQRSLVISIGLSRDPVAVNFLISQLELKLDPRTVIDALKPSCVYQEIRARVREALNKLNDRALVAEFDRKFESMS
jgi:hypothetical protein